ncbi:SOS response-associated peptidase [Paenibacillus sp. HB172176]|uniref:SOS response-associated peptidase n=1 Tax=Paenibacillus sp. HB172176 TaxID=2493690 RepID=UPI00143A9C55|nr:SOS response-associated peptidase [Paenibacillus sp. HB172176]
MCGRYTLTITLEELLMRYGIDETTIPYSPKYNIAPRQMVLAIVHDGSKNRMGELSWGLVPPWADDPKIGSGMINARAETAAAKPAFKDALKRKRCLIPADGFYEWQEIEQNGKKRKQPMRVVAKDRSIFSLAGLYETWQSPGGDKLSSCTILTTTPNELMKPIHDRMPVIVHERDEALWLDRSVQDPARLERLLAPYPSHELEAYPVEAAVGNVRNDDASLIAPQAEDEQLRLW